MTTQVGILGAGPDGLFLAHLLKQQGVESVILEAGTIDTLHNLGLDERMEREGLVDNGLDMRFKHRNIHLDLPGLTGRAVKIHGQQEVVKDLIDARLKAGDPLIFDAEVVRLENLDSDAPRIHYRHEGEDKVLDCALVAGCDGFHGIARASVPAGVIAQQYVALSDVSD